MDLNSIEYFLNRHVIKNYINEQKMVDVRLVKNAVERFYCILIGGKLAERIEFRETGVFKIYKYDVNGNVCGERGGLLPTSPKTVEIECPIEKINELLKMIELQGLKYKIKGEW